MSDFWHGHLAGQRVAQGASSVTRPLDLTGAAPAHGNRVGAAESASPQHEPRASTSDDSTPGVPVESREQPRGDDAEIIHGDWPHQRCIEMLAKRIQTIRELRAEAAREFESGNEWCQRALDSEAALETTRAERDRARDLAAHLEEDSERLQEQLEAVRALAADPCLGMGCTANCLEHIDAADVLAILEGK